MTIPRCAYKSSSPPWPVPEGQWRSRTCDVSTLYHENCVNACCIYATCPGSHWRTCEVSTLYLENCAHALSQDMDIHRQTILFIDIYVSQRYIAFHHSSLFSICRMRLFKLNCFQRVMCLLHSSVSSALSGLAANCWEDILKWKLAHIQESTKVLINRVLGTEYRPWYLTFLQWSGHTI